MIRANLLPRQSRTLTAFGASVDLLHLRHTSINIGVIVLVVGLVAAVQLGRLHGSNQEAAVAEALASANDGPRRALTALAQQVAALQRVERESGLVRHSGNDVAAALVAVGNAVPMTAWLDGIAQQPDGFVLSGSARGLEDVGATLDGLSGRNSGRASLINVINDSPRHATHFTIRLSNNARVYL